MLDEGSNVRDGTNGRRHISRFLSSASGVVKATGTAVPAAPAGYLSSIARKAVFPAIPGGLPRAHSFTAMTFARVLFRHMAKMTDNAQTTSATGFRSVVTLRFSIAAMESTYCSIATT